MRPIALLAVMLLAACASTPPAGDALEKARAAVRAAQSDPQVAQYASAELDLATQALRDAERSADEPAHRAYLAQQRARIARQLAAARAFEAQTDRDVRDRLAAEVRRLKAQVEELEAEKNERAPAATGATRSVR